MIDVNENGDITKCDVCCRTANAIVHNDHDGSVDAFNLLIYEITDTWVCGRCVDMANRIYVD